MLVNGGGDQKKIELVGFANNTLDQSLQESSFRDDELRNFPVSVIIEFDIGKLTSGNMVERGDG
jgi:hypothetical protein